VTLNWEIIMAATTTLKLPEELKARIASAAQASGKASHAFMVEALAIQTTLSERRQAFIASATKAEQEVADYGLIYEADEVFGYLKAKINGKKTKWPKAKKL
jgi:predicted transcriptional regulator